MKDLIICTIFFLIAIPILPNLLQLKSEVNNSAFRLIKIKHLSFLFRAPNGMSVSKDGIATPIFVSQLLGYILFLILTTLNLLCYFISEKIFFIMVGITCLLFVIEAVVLVIFDIILLRLSRSNSISNEINGKRRKSNFLRTWKQVRSFFLTKNYLRYII